MNQNAIITLVDAKYFPMLEELVDSINTHEQSKKISMYFRLRAVKDKTQILTYCPIKYVKTRNKLETKEIN